MFKTATVLMSAKSVTRNRPVLTLLMEKEQLLNYAHNAAEFKLVACRITVSSPPGCCSCWPLRCLVPQESQVRRRSISVLRVLTSCAPQRWSSSATASQQIRCHRTLIPIGLPRLEGCNTTGGSHIPLMHCLHPSIWAFSKVVDS